MHRILPLALLAVAGCAHDPGKPGVPPAPVIVEVPVPTFVPIDAGLTERCKWVKSAPLEQALSVARGRKKCLEFYEANLGAIEQVQGKPVPEK